MTDYDEIMKKRKKKFGSHEVESAEQIVVQETPETNIERGHEILR